MACSRENFTFTCLQNVANFYQNLPRHICRRRLLIQEPVSLVDVLQLPSSQSNGSASDCDREIFNRVLPSLKCASDVFFCNDYVSRHAFCRDTHTATTFTLIAVAFCFLNLQCYSSSCRTYTVYTKEWCGFKSE
jgi:hypothetical protein